MFDFIDLSALSITDVGGKLRIWLGVVGSFSLERVGILK
jgi:hypothetical protein